MTDAITIRDADLNQPEDQQAVRALLSAYAADPMGRGCALSQAVQQQLIAGLREHPTSLVLLAFQHDRPAGVAVCFRGFSTFAARPLLNIHDLAVLPESRGHGIGRHLLHAVHQRAASLGCCKVTLEVRQDNPVAQRLYRSFGYGDANGNADGARMLFWSRDLGGTQ